MVDSIIREVGTALGATVMDWLLVLAITGLFFLMKSISKSIKSSLSKVEVGITHQMEVGATTVKEHLKSFNQEQDRNWGNLSKLIEELKRDKVWQNVYDKEIELLKAMGKIRDEKIKVLEECFRNTNFGRRTSDK
jgi:hypothetical protein